MTKNGKKSSFGYVKNGDYSNSYGTPEYIAFVICDMSDQVKKHDGFLDEAWEKSLELADKFINGKYDVSTKGLWECIEEFLANEGV